MFASAYTTDPDFRSTVNTAIKDGIKESFATPEQGMMTVGRAVGGIAGTKGLGEAVAAIKAAARLRAVSGMSATTAAETINPATVRFSQSSIKATFGEGESVADLAAGLKNGTVKAGDIPAIRLVERDGQLFTLDNRRLEAFRQAGIDVPYRMATPQEAAAEAWKFTTKNGGTSVRVRGGP